MNTPQFVNTKGAARRLGCTETWIHRLVANGKLKAYAYDENGTLVEHLPDERRHGQGLYFFRNNLEVYQPDVSRRPRRRKNKSSAE